MRSRSTKSTRLVAFASGKGGVGKTICTANLALHMARKHEVLTVDLDLGCGNLNASLGIRSVTQSIEDFITARVTDLAPLKMKTSLDGLQLISCSFTPVNNTALAESQKEKLLEQLRSDESDYVFVDLGAGVAHDTLDFFAAADLKILVTLPESLALHNAFVFVKSLAYRVLVRALERTKLSRKHRQAIVQQLYSGGGQEIGKIIAQLRTRDPGAAALIEESLDSLNVGVILNKLQDPAEEKFIISLQRLAKKYANINLAFLGSIPFDLNIKKSLNDVVPFALEYESSPANAAFASLTLGIERSIAAFQYLPDVPSTPESSRLLRRLAFWGTGAHPLYPLGLRNIAASSPNRTEKDEMIRTLECQLSETASRFEREKRDWLKESEVRDRQAAELTNSIQQKDELIASLKKTGEARIAESQKLIQERDEVIRNLEARLRATVVEVEALRRRQGFQVSPPDGGMAKQRLTELEKLARRSDQIRNDQMAGNINARPGPVRFDEFQRRGLVDGGPALPGYPDKPASSIAEHIIASLSAHSSQAITVVSMQEGLLETASFANELAMTLSAARWRVTSIASSFKDNPFTGLRIVHDHSEDAVRGAGNLALALTGAGIPCSLQRSAFSTEFDGIHLMVGLNDSAHLRVPRTLGQRQAPMAKSTSNK